MTAILLFATIGLAPVSIAFVVFFCVAMKGWKETLDLHRETLDGWQDTLDILKKAEEENNTYRPQQ